MDEQKVIDNIEFNKESLLNNLDSSIGKALEEIVMPQNREQRRKLKKLEQKLKKEKPNAYNSFKENIKQATYKEALKRLKEYRENMEAQENGNAKED